MLEILNTGVGVNDVLCHSRVSLIVKRGNNSTTPTALAALTDDGFHIIVILIIDPASCQTAESAFAFLFIAWQGIHTHAADKHRNQFKIRPLTLSFTHLGPTGNDWSAKASTPSSWIVWKRLPNRSGLFGIMPLLPRKIEWHSPIQKKDVLLTPLIS